MRPRIGKTKWYDKVSPSEQKELDKVAKKWIVVRFLHKWNDPTNWIQQERWCVDAMEDSEPLRWRIKTYFHAEVLMERLTERDARMWVKMIE